MITVRDAGELAGVLRCAVRTGDMVNVLPGVFVPGAADLTHQVRALAATRYAPSAVLTGRSAAALLGWPRLEPNVITMATPTELRDQPGFSFTRDRIDPEWITTIDGIRCTNKFLTAVDLIPELGGELVDDVLREHPRRGAWALAQLWQAFGDHPNRPGNNARREILTDSRDRPWSEAERMAHRALREAGITGWCTNFELRIDGRTFFLDLAFPELRLAIEINGFEWHSRREAFEKDHQRRNEVNLDGWLVLEFTWRMVTDDPAGFVRTVLRAMGQR
ncbi:endonuclease domain-containing protein [Enemella evansiae]|uniref:endonuclease domain-containing protein n=1 Tax=Enemella evansiae TaxID=2016499 RepID=UPI0010E77204|nr:DUF559 domain-containing protein [Enemella evansiae]TDO88098.1 very-short-patch-repair endonuclease [Enemella evansiae]